MVALRMSKCRRLNIINDDYLGLISFHALLASFSYDRKLLNGVNGRASICMTKKRNEMCFHNSILLK